VIEAQELLTNQGVWLAQVAGKQKERLEEVF
jgi:hypothetical protein